MFKLPSPAGCYVQKLRSPVVYHNRKVRPTHARNGSMRTQTLPTLTTVQKTGASLVGDNNSRSRSPLAEYATALLRARVDKGRISTTTFDLYVLELESLVNWVATQGIAWGTTASEVACDAWAVAPSSPTQRRVRTTLLCELTGWEHVRRRSRLVTGRAAS